MLFQKEAGKFLFANELHPSEIRTKIKKKMKKLYINMRGRLLLISRIFFAHKNNFNTCVSNFKRNFARSIVVYEFFLMWKIYINNKCYTSIKKNMLWRDGERKKKRIITVACKKNGIEIKIHHQRIAANIIKFLRYLCDWNIWERKSLWCFTRFIAAMCFQSQIQNMNSHFFANYFNSSK